MVPVDFRQAIIISKHSLCLKSMALWLAAWAVSSLRGIHPVLQGWSLPEWSSLCSHQLLSSCCLLCHITLCLGAFLPLPLSLMLFSQDPEAVCSKDSVGRWDLGSEGSSNGFWLGFGVHSSYAVGRLQSWSGKGWSAKSANQTSQPGSPRTLPAIKYLL